MRLINHMKPESSFSSPSSCNVHENPSNCRNGRTAAGCLSRILHKILCFSSLPLCSFDHFHEDGKESSVLIGASGITPGIVARLMGLESLPRVKPIEASPSMSSGDSCKKSTSPRRMIIPAYQELEDDNFFILSFEKRGSRHESHIGRRKSGKNSVRKEQGKCKKKSTRCRSESLEGKNKENEDVNIVSQENCQVENPAAISSETEDGSENSSPNSVLEFLGFATDQESASSGEISRLANSKMRRPLSDKLENCGNAREKKLMENGDGEKEKISSRLRSRVQNHAEKWDEIGSLAAMETTKSSWIREETSKNQLCFMEIGRDLESNILDQLLDELLISLGEFFTIDTVTQISCL